MLHNYHNNNKKKLIFYIVIFVQQWTHITYMLHKLEVPDKCGLIAQDTNVLMAAG